MSRAVLLPRCCALAAGVVAAAALAGVSAPVASQTQVKSQPQAPSQVLYTLQTRCSLNGGAAVPCTVEALNEGKATLYRHTIGRNVETIRITDAPVRMQRLDASSKRWSSLTLAAARFSSNTVCFNGRDLCVVNPNYLNSVQQQSSAAMAGRDLVKVHFGGDGRIDATCYDNGCEVNLK